MTKKSKFSLKPQSRNLILSALVHGCVIGGMWLTATEYTPDAVVPPQVIDTTILAPTPEPEPEISETTVTPTIPDPEPIITSEVEKPITEPITTAKKSNDSEGKSAENGMESKAKDSIGENQKNDGQSSSAGLDDKNPKTGNDKGLGQQGTGEDSSNSKKTEEQAPPPPAKVEQKSGIPAPVVIKDSGFTVVYEAKGNYKGFNAGGGGKLIFTKSGDTYNSSLEASAAGFGITATSKGQIRNGTIAVESFKDEKRILIKGSRFNTFRVDYATKEMHFGGGGIQPLPYDTVYDYLSAIIYVQSFFQSGKTNASFTLPVARSSTIGEMRVQSSEPSEVETDDGTFIGIPVTFDIENGSIANIKAWFVPSKQYRPMRIEIKFKDEKGYVNLVSRNSPD